MNTLEKELMEKENLAQIRKTIGGGFSIIALVTIGSFVEQTDFSIQLQSYLDLQYCMQFVPLILSLLLLYGGISLFINHPKANFALVLFGYAALEEILFSWVGLTSTYLSDFSIVLLFCCSVIALIIAHSNAFNLKKLSYWELIISIAFGAIESFLPSFF